MKDEALEKVKAALRNPKDFDRSEPVTADRYLSTGCSVLNLACTGELEGGLIPGHYYLVCGDSSSGKTFLGMTILAEAANNRMFDNYRLIYDNPEGGALMDVSRFFGTSVASRLEPAAVDEQGMPRSSTTVQEFYYHVDDWLDSGKPFVAVLDSQDCLTTDEESSRFEEQKKAFRRGKDTAGSYGDNKAKLHSANLRRLMGPLRDTGSILVILNQSRDSFDPFNPDAYSGGRALLFYATLQLWSKSGGAIKRVVRGKERQLGIYSKVRVKKNRVTGRDRSVKIRIYHSYGIDDVGTMVDYLVSEGYWKESGGVLEVTGLGPDFKGKTEQVIERIENEGLVDDLKALVKSTWLEVEKACEVRRKRRYE